MLCNAEGEQEVIAIIPSRKGSKRLPGKNWKLFAGRPLVLWTIEQAKQCKIIDKVIISTDDPIIMEIGWQTGCEIHHREPKDAVDHVNLMQVIPDFITQNCLIILLQPTSPLRALKDIETGFSLYHPGFSVVSVSKINPYSLMLNGAVYITHIDILREHRDFYNPIYFVMPKERSIDIDTQEDWNMAEAIAKQNAIGYNT